MDRFRAFLVLLLCYLFFTSFVLANPSQDTIFSTILSRVHQENLVEVNDIQIFDELVDRDLANLDWNTGKWNQYDYSDHKRIDVDWMPVLDKMERLTVAYTHPQSRHYQQPRVWEAINKSLMYFTRHKPLPYCDNWYQQGITRPQSLTRCLINMHFGIKDIEEEVRKAAIAAICKDTARTSNGRNNPNHVYNSGANKAQIAKGWVWMGALLRDKKMLEIGVREVYAPIAYTTGEGIQYDLSYDMHYGYLYNGTYGLDFAKSVVQTANYTLGTPYALTGEKLSLFSRFVRQSFFSLIRGSWMDWNIMGRGISRANIMKKDHSKLLMQLIKIDGSNKAYYELILKREQGTLSVSEGIVPNHSYYWHTDYTVHLRPTYFMSVHAVSKRNFSQEIGNLENLCGYWGAQGTMNLQRRGDEYYNIFPYWNWAFLPGTTLPDTVPVLQNKAPGSGDRRGTSDFVGGVSDSLYGVTAYKVDQDMKTSAQKAWFMFDKEIICLGAGISSSLPQHINTTINQVWLSKGGVFAGESGNKKIIKLNESYTVNDKISWIWHDSIAYLFPTPSNVNLLQEERSGSWSTISGGARVDKRILESRPVFQLSLGHGAHPDNAKYAYAIVPYVIHPQLVQKYKIKDSWSIVSNTTSLQAVYHHRLAVRGIVFYDAKVSYEDKQMKIWTSEPALVLLRSLSKGVYELHLADPTQSLNVVNVAIQLKDKKDTVKQFSLQLPQKPFAGQSVSLRFIM